MLSIRLPSFPLSRHDLIVRLLTLDARREDGRVLVPGKANPKPYQIADHVRRTERVTISRLFRAVDDFNRAIHALSYRNNTSVLYAIEEAAHIRGLNPHEKVALCESLAICGLSAGREAFPYDFQTLVDRVGKHQGDLGEALFDVTETDATPYKPMRHNYLRYKVQQLDRLASRWNLDHEGRAPAEYNSVMMMITALNGRPIPLIPLSHRLPNPRSRLDRS